MFNSTMEIGIIQVFYLMQPLNPSFWLFRSNAMQILFQTLVSHFSLPVRLGWYGELILCWVPINWKISIQKWLRKIGPQSPMIMKIETPWNFTTSLKKMLVTLLAVKGCRREKKMNILRESINHHKHTIKSLRFWKPSNKIHRDILPYTIWNRKWL